MKIGFTGTQIGMSQHQKEQFVLKLMSLGVTEFHHGDCIGADAQAHDIVREFFPEVIIVGHIPQSNGKRAFKRCDKYRDPLPYLVRDRIIVDESDMLIGCPKTDGEVLRSGTWATIRYSRKLNKPQEILKR
jgi:hypothetical protein